MRCILAKIHLSFEGVIFLIQGVSGALRQKKTLSKNNVLMVEIQHPTWKKNGLIFLYTSEWFWSFQRDSCESLWVIAT